MSLSSRVQLAIATGGYVGYLPYAPGTFGSLVGLLIYLLLSDALSASLPFHLALIVILFCLGLTTADTSCDVLKKEDPAEVVIDEIVGMLVTMIALPYSFFNVCMGFALFRFFDIKKPGIVRVMEEYPRGWGIMLDDLVAGILANIVLRLILLVFA